MTFTAALLLSLILLAIWVVLSVAWVAVWAAVADLVMGAMEGEDR